MQIGADKKEEALKLLGWLRSVTSLWFLIFVDNL